MTNLERDIAKLQQRLNIMQYYFEQRSDDFRRQMEKQNLGLIKRQNIDTKNLVILEKELENLRLGKNPTPEEQQRMKALEQKITELKASGESGGNTNTQDRPDRR